jgi:hypothetical protein
MSTGRNFDEVGAGSRSVSAHRQAQGGDPAELEAGDDVTIYLAAVSDDEARQKYPGGWKASRPDLRIVP